MKKNLSTPILLFISIFLTFNANASAPLKVWFACSPSSPWCGPSPDDLIPSRWDFEIDGVHFNTPYRIATVEWDKTRGYTLDNHYPRIRITHVATTWLRRYTRVIFDEVWRGPSSRIVCFADEDFVKGCEQFQ